jgi:hypothetical protein
MRPGRRAGRRWKTSTCRKAPPPHRPSLSEASASGTQSYQNSSSACPWAMTSRARRSVLVGRTTVWIRRSLSLVSLASPLEIGCTISGVAGASVEAGGGIEQQARARRQASGVGLVDDIGDQHLARAWLGQQSGVVGDVALHVPGGSDGFARLHRGAVVEVHAGEVDDGGAVELPAGGDVEIGFQHDLGPGPRQAAGGA